MAEDCCLFDALNAVISMFIFSSVDNGVTDDHSETSAFIVRFYSFMFSEIFFNMNSFSLKIEMRNKSSLVNGSKTVIKVNSRQGNLTSMRDCCLLYTSPSPRDQRGSRMPSSA